MVRRRSATWDIANVNLTSSMRPTGFNPTYQTKHAQNVGHEKRFTPFNKGPRVSQERGSKMPQQVPRRCGLVEMLQLVLFKPREQPGPICFGSLTDGKSWVGS